MKRFTDDEWRRMPAALKKQYWKETDYGRQEPRPELIAEMKEVVNDQKMFGHWDA